MDPNRIAWKVFSETLLVALDVFSLWHPRAFRRVEEEMRRRWPVDFSEWGSFQARQA